MNPKLARWIPRVIVIALIAAATAVLWIKKPWEPSASEITFTTVSVTKGSISAQVTAATDVALGNFRLLLGDVGGDAAGNYQATLTQVSTRLVQLRLHPDIILDQAQPNLLDPATDDGKALMKAIRNVSTTLAW